MSEFVRASDLDDDAGGECDWCDGDGRVPDLGTDCPYCDGTGVKGGTSP
ncbi:MAG: hypothetical protein ACOCZD_02230 [Haloferacaceae archaeon]